MNVKKSKMAEFKMADLKMAARCELSHLRTMVNSMSP